MRPGWELVKLGSVCDIQNGFAFDSKLFNNEGKGLPLIRIRDIKRGYSETFTTENCDEAYVVKDGEYLVGMDGEFNIGQWKSENALLNQRVCKLLPSSKVLPRLIYYYIPKALKDIEAKTAYATVKHLSSKQIKEISIPNLPLPEQQRIVDILDQEFAKIDALKANAEKSLQAAKDLFQATLKKELEPKEGWSDISIGSVASLITKGASPKWQGIQYVSSGGILFITSENVREGFIDISLPKYVETAFNGKQARSILQKDDVLVNIVGASIGRAAVYTLDVKDANVNQAVALVRLNKDRVFPDYLCCFLNSKMAEAFYTSMKKDTARANLSLENISNIVFPCPKDITEQKAVAKKLHYEQQLCRQVENNYQKTLTLCDDLKQALLRKAFNGEL